MVLAVNIAGDRSADGHESCTGRDGNKEAPWHDRAHQLVETDTRPDCCASGGRVEDDVACTRCETHDQSPTVLGCVAVATAQPASERSTVAGLLQRRRQCGGIDRHLVSDRRIGTSPAPEAGAGGGRHAARSYPSMVLVDGRVRSRVRLPLARRRGDR